MRRGVLEERRIRRLGLFESTRYPELDPEPERRLRADLADVLVTGREPTADEAMLVSLLNAYDLVKRVVAREHRGTARRRAKEISKGDAVGSAVRSTVDGVQAATMAAVVAATAATTATAGGGSWTSSPPPGCRPAGACLRPPGRGRLARIPTAARRTRWRSTSWRRRTRAKA